MHDLIPNFAPDSPRFTAFSSYWGVGLACTLTSSLRGGAGGGGSEGVATVIAVALALALEVAMMLAIVVAVVLGVADSLVAGGGAFVLVLVLVFVGVVVGRSFHVTNAPTPITITASAINIPRRDFGWGAGAFG